ncbi:MAG: hypothetical protein HUJ27_13645 [Rhodobacteraceae bacterium]|nr:hypothetical protein [Paracoccaceae bacterium]
MRILVLAAGLAVSLLGGEAARAQGKTMTLAADASLEASGLLAYLVPRFALKTGIRVTVVAESPDGLPGLAAQAGADALVGPETIARAIVEAGHGRGRKPAFYTEDEAAGGSFAALLVEGAAEPDHAARFVKWLTSEVGQRTVASFAAEGAPVYLPGAIKVAAPAPVEIEGDVDAGEILAFQHCGRCHVIGERNKFGGIGSTPSFPALRTIEGWEGKFLAFYALNPHPSFTQVEGITEPFDPDRPPHIAPVEITLDEMQAIAAFVSTIQPKDLGAPIQSR